MWGLLPNQIKTQFAVTNSCQMVAMVPEEASFWTCSESLMWSNSKLALLMDSWPSRREGGGGDRTGGS